jgi:hypothetical protein
MELPFIKCLKFDSNKHSAKVMNHLLFVIQNNFRFNNLHTNQPHIQSNDLLNDFRLEMIRLARKQENFTLSSKHLLNTLQIVNNSIISQPQQSTNLSENIKFYIETYHDKSPIMNTIQVELEYESAKLLYCMGKEANKYETLGILLKSVSKYIDQQMNGLISANDKLNEICSKSILYVCKVFNKESPTFLNDILMCKDESASSVNNSLMYLLNLKNVYNFSLNFDHYTTDPVHSDKEHLIGDLLDLSTFVCTGLAKSWYTLANWCYKQGMSCIHNLKFLQFDGISS